MSERPKNVLHLPRRSEVHGAARVINADAYQAMESIG
jgi:hypothetical protein